jgi:hypothetical protein
MDKKKTEKKHKRKVATEKIQIGKSRGKKRKEKGKELPGEEKII